MADNCKLYVGNISFGLSEASLREHFDTYGTVLDCKIVLDRDTGRSRGFAFITFSDESEANYAANESHKLDGRDLRVSIAESKRGGGRAGYGGGGGGGGGYQQRSYGGGGNYQQRSNYGGGDGYDKYGGGGRSYGGSGGSGYRGGSGYDGDSYGSGGRNSYGGGGGNYSSGGGGGGW